MDHKAIVRTRNGDIFSKKYNKGEALGALINNARVLYSYSRRLSLSPSQPFLVDFSSVATFNPRSLTVFIEVSPPGRRRRCAKMFLAIRIHTYIHGYNAVSANNVLRSYMASFSNGYQASNHQKLPRLFLAVNQTENVGKGKREKWRRYCYGCCIACSFLPLLLLLDIQAE